jgi:hypothetical protein
VQRAKLITTEGARNGENKICTDRDRNTTQTLTRATKKEGAKRQEAESGATGRHQGRCKANRQTPHPEISSWPSGDWSFAPDDCDTRRNEAQS